MKQWDNIPERNLYKREDFWVCPICEFHFNKRTFSVETLELHIEKCSKRLADETVQIQLELHPEVSEDDSEGDSDDGKKEVGDVCDPILCHRKHGHS